MPVKVRIPTPLRKLTSGEGEVSAIGKTVVEVLDDLESKYPGFRERLFDESGNLRRFINIYLNDEDIRFLNGPDTVVKDSDEISIIPAIAGGLPGFKIRLTFPEGRITEPVIYRIGHEFKLKTNIRRADIQEKSGWAVLELTGETPEIERAVSWLKGMGIKVDPIEGTVIE
jgi:molybdopterin synthase sulfur carrier subunit